jgi:C4-dicarboxylate transporter DctQ subunit
VGSEYSKGWVQMKFIKKIGRFLLDLIEVYIPIITFSVMFSMFVVQIFYRYYLNEPLTWAYEVTTITFIWTVLLGACYARRRQDHVSFTILYDLMTDRVQMICRILGNLLIAVAFIVAIYPVYDYTQFLYTQKSSVLRIPFNIAFAPFLIFLLLTIGHSLYDVFIDLKKIFVKKSLSLESNEN